MLTDWTKWHPQEANMENLHELIDARRGFFHDTAATKYVTWGTCGCP